MSLLYHFSEDPAIERFAPHVPATNPVEEPLVWAVDAEHAHIYYFPRQRPRVTFYTSSRTSPEDVERFFGQTDARKVVAIESGWLDRLRSTTLYRYVLPGENFELRDAGSGYWVSRAEVTPLQVEPVGDLFSALLSSGAEVRMLPSLWPLYEAVIASTLEFSIIRWRNALPRPEGLKWEASREARPDALP